MEDKQPPSERNAKRKRDEDLPLEEVILSPLFKTPSMLATLLCPVCMNVMQEPMVLSPCGHTFCKMCCGKFAPKKCPLDRRAFGSIIPNHHTKCIMAEVRCKCDFDDCKKLFSVSERADHLKKCDFRPIDCIHGCGTILLQKDFKAHDGICPQKKIPCPHDGCNDRPRRKDYERHCNRCPHRIFQCQGSEMGCKFMGKKSEHSIHEDMCIYVKYQKLKPFEKYIQRHQKNRNLIFFRQLGTEICVHKRELLLEYIDGKEILICGKEFSFDENTTFSDLLQAAGGTMSNVSFRRSRRDKLSSKREFFSRARETKEVKKRQQEAKKLAANLKQSTGLTKQAVTKILQRNPNGLTTKELLQLVLVQCNEKKEGVSQKLKPILKQVGKRKKVDKKTVWFLK